MKNFIEHLKTSRSKKLNDFLKLNALRIKRYSLMVNELMRKKNLILGIAVFFINVNQNFAQEIKTDSLRTQIFSLSPLSKKVGQVNGMVLGVGIWEDERPIKINGLNFEVHPLAILGLLMFDPDKVEPSNSSNIYLNGLNISGGSYGAYHIKGISINAMNISHITDGLGISISYNVLQKANGVHVTGIYNYIENGNGLFIASIYNNIEELNGLSIGTINRTEINKGLQIGIVNINKSKKGFQLGLWNINEKRTLPFINW